MRECCGALADSWSAKRAKNARKSTIFDQLEMLSVMIAEGLRPFLIAVQPTRNGETGE
jgi:hypothetical protein